MFNFGNPWFGEAFIVSAYKISKVKNMSFLTAAKLYQNLKGTSKELAVITYWNIFTNGNLN